MIYLLKVPNGNAKLIANRLDDSDKSYAMNLSGSEVLYVTGKERKDRQNIIKAVDDIVLNPQKQLDQSQREQALKIDFTA